MNTTTRKLTSFDGKTLLQILLLTAIHFLVTKFCDIFITLPGGVSAVWPVAGIDLAALLLLGYKIWPGILLGAFFYELTHASPNLINIFYAIIYAVTETGEAILAYYLIHRFLPNRNPLHRAKDVFLFVLLVALISPLTSTLINVTKLCVTGNAPWASYTEILWTWWTSIVVGRLIFTPIFLAWSENFWQSIKYIKRSFIEFSIIFWLIIFLNIITLRYGYPLEYMFVPLLVWAAFRFEQQGASLAIVFIAVISIIETAQGRGSFVRNSLNESLVLLQSFLAVISLSTLALVAVLHENKQAQKHLQQINLELEKRVAERTSQLQESVEKANIANRAKSDFLANMSHELRTPLNGVLGYAQILQNDKTLNKDQQEGVNIIYNCGSHLLTLINDILDISKIEAKKMEVYPEDLHFHTFLTGVIEMCKIKADQKNISFVSQLSSNLPEAVKVDQKRLRQVLVNLLGNAIKFTDQGGVIFKVEQIETTSKKRVKIRFQIEDTGIGMTPEQLEKIFLPFEQVGDKSREIEGTGLGLSITKKILELMSSEIHVKSEINQGSAFDFEIEVPLGNTFFYKRNLLSYNQIIGYKGPKRKILVVDDRWENRSVVVDLLTPLNFEVIEAQNGIEGLEKNAQLHPDLIITDLVMPKMHGFEMVRQLRQQPEYDNLVIITSSASVFEADQNKSIEYGSNDFISKPIQIAELLTKLQQYLQLEWIYETPEQLPTDAGVDVSPESITSALKIDSEIIAPNQEKLEQLYDLAKQGLFLKIEDIAEALKDSEQIYQPFADRILEFCSEFESEKLQNFLKQYL